MRNINRQLQGLREHVSHWVDLSRRSYDRMSGTSWERLSVAYPDPVVALRAVEGWRLERAGR